MDPVSLVLGKSHTDYRLVDLISDSNVAVNLFDPRGLIEHETYIQSSTGNKVSGTSSSGINTLSDYIPVQAGRYYHSHYATIALYDAEKVWVGGIRGDDARIIDIDSTVKWVRISFRNRDLFDLRFGPYVANPVRPVGEVSRNLFNKDTIVPYLYYNSSTGNAFFGTSSTGINFTSSPIPVIPGKTYTRNRRSSVLYYDSNNSFIGGYYNRETGTGTFVPPAGTAYIRVCGVLSALHEFQVEEGDKETSYEPYGVRVSNLVYGTDRKPSLPFTFSDVLRDLNGRYVGGVSLSTYPDDPVITMESVDNAVVEIPYFFPVSEGHCVLVRVKATGDNISGGNARVTARFYRRGNQIYGAHRYDLTDVGNHMFRFPVPEGVDCIEVSLSVRGSKTLTVRNYDLALETNARPPLQGLRFIAHRGTRDYAPENTLPAFRYARNAGFYGCVINTGRTSDGHLVVLHDDDVDRTSNGSGKIYEMTFEQVRQLDFGSWFHPLFAGTQIPTLDEVLGFCAKSGLHPYIRLSRRFTNNNDGTYSDIYNLLIKHGLLHRVSFKAFGQAELNALKSVAGDTVRYGYTVYEIDQGVVDFVKSLDVPETFIDCRHDGITQEGIDLAIYQGIPVESWIIDDFATIEQLAKMGVTGFTTGTMCLDGCWY